MMFQCDLCGSIHEGVPTDLAYRRPVNYFMVPDNERATRCHESDDLCVIDDSIFLLRGVLEVPIIDQPNETLTWGMWASVSQTSFERYYELFDVDAESEPPFRGLLAVSPTGYPNLIDAEVIIQLRSAKSRPLFTPANRDHPLFAEHFSGITAARWHEIALTAMPWLAKP